MRLPENKILPLHNLPWATMNKNADVLVIIPHYNNPTGLSKTIAVIQETINIDIIVIDDGSQIQPDISNLKSSVSKNIKILYHRLDENRGIEYALNCGLDVAIAQKYQFIARIDCGDLPCPFRFEKQRDFLNNNTDYGMVGSWVTFFLGGNDLFTLKLPTNHNDLKKTMYWRNAFIHPAVMITGKALEVVGKYPTTYPKAEDYAYFFSIISKFKCANLPLVLTKCEYNEKGISISSRRTQIITSLKLILNFRPVTIYTITGLIRFSILLITPCQLIEAIKKWKT